MHKIKTLAAVAVLLALGATTAMADGIYRESHDLGFGDNSSLDPSSQGRVFSMTEKIMNRLVRPGLDGRPEADLAVSWSANEDASVWTFNLRSGVKFHDGSDFDANDAKYSLDRILHPDSESPAKSAIKMISGVTVVDDMTLEIALNTSFADMPLQLMDYRLRMIPDGSGDTIALSGIGTGPFKVEVFDPQGTTILVANEDYWEGAPQLAGMELIGIPDAQARFQALQGGQIDTLRGIPNQQRRILESAGNFYVQEVPTGNWRGLVFRTDVEPFSDVRVRQALRHLADREALVQLVLGGGGIVSCDVPVAPTDQYFAGLECPYDLETAKQLLADAGYADGLNVELYIANLEPTWPTLAQAYQQMAAAANVNVEIVTVPSKGFWSTAWMQKDAYATRWLERPTDQAMHEIYLCEAKWNESYFCDEHFNDLLSMARRELDFEKRKQIYIDAQSFLYENTGTLIPYTVTRLIAASDKVQNMDAAKSDAVRWHLVTKE